MSTQAFPAVPAELLKALELIYPDTLPSDPVSAEEIARLVGRQQVIRKMRYEFGRQTGALQTIKA